MADTKPRLKIENERASQTDAAGESASQAGGAGAGAGVGAGAGTGAGAGAGAGKPSTRGGNPFSNARRATSDWLGRNFPGHENAVFGGICGLVVALLVFLIGFWRTLFIVVCVLVGVAIGQYLDGNPTVVKAVRKFFGSNGAE